MRLKFWVGITVSVSLLVLMFWWIGFDFRKLWDAMKSVEPWHLAAATALNLAIYIIRAVRWRYLMDPVKKDVKISHLFSATLIGFMANNLLPARLGEIIRAYVLGRREGVSKSSVFATIVVERIFDGLSVIVLLIIVLTNMPESVSGGTLAHTIRRAGTFSIIAVVLLIVITGFLTYRQGFLESITGRIFSPFPRLKDKAVALVEKFVSGLSVIKNPRLLALIVFYSALHWGLLWVPIYIVFRGFGLDMGPYAAVFILVVIAFAVAVPSTPGYIGTFHAAVAAGLMLFNIQKEQALAIAVLVHAMGFIPVTLVGLYYLSRENLTLSSLKTAEAGVEK